MSHPHAARPHDPSASEWRVRLTVVDGPNAGRAFDFADHATFVVGRGSDAHFRLPEDDPYVSRLHFMVEANPPLCRLIDMNSRNGTRINGERVEAAALLSGDRVTAGRTAFVVTVEASGSETIELPAAGGSEDWVARQEQAYRCGGAWRARDLVAREPALAGRLETLAELIAQEAGFREADREPWSLAEYQRAFPQVAEVLPLLLDRNRVAKDLTAATVQAPFPAIPGHRIVRELGRGGMGAVYLAMEDATGEEVAVKAILPKVRVRGDAAARFLREAGILARLDHPNIVRCRGSGSAGDLLYFVMDYVPGEDAARLVRREGPLAIPRAVRLNAQMLEGLAFAHAKGVVHRDLKPGNLLICRNGAIETVRIADFGLAKSYQESSLSGLTVSGTAAGTPHYMPPEQLLDFKSVRPAGDQYSAAVTLYFLLSGQLPFAAGGKPQDWFKALFEAVPTPLRTHRPEVPEALAAAIHRAMSRDPTHRFSDATAFARALLAAVPAAAS